MPQQTDGRWAGSVQLSVSDNPCRAVSDAMGDLPPRTKKYRVGVVCREIYYKRFEGREMMDGMGRSLCLEAGHLTCACG